MNRKGLLSKLNSADFHITQIAMLCLLGPFNTLKGALYLIQTGNRSLLGWLDLIWSMFLGIFGCILLFIQILIIRTPVKTENETDGNQKNALKEERKWRINTFVQVLVNTLYVYEAAGWMKEENTAWKYFHLAGIILFGTFSLICVLHLFSGSLRKSRK